MESIKQFIAALAIDAELKAELAADQLLQKHGLYLRLARYLAPAFPPLPATVLGNLTGYSYVYFRFLLGLDSLLDSQSTSGVRSAQRLFSSLEMHEQAVRGLGQLFPTIDEFWPAFGQCKQEYAAANLREKHLSALRTDITETQFEEIAAGKSAVCYAMVHALSSLSGSTAPVAELRRCLQHLHVALQYLDDVEDFRQDWQQGQYTYAHYLVESHLRAGGLAVGELALAARHRHLYTSGVAQLLLQRGHDHYAHSLAIADALGLPELGRYLQQQLVKCQSYQQDVDRLLQKTRIKAGKSFTPLYPELPPASPQVLQTAVQKGLQHLRLSRDAQGCWTDFMTSAGQSKLWVTAYAGLQLAEIKEGQRIAHDAFDASAFLPASYNESIMQDGDSTNFSMGLSRKVWGETTPQQLQTWLAFMDADGGWVTYRNGAQLRQRLELPAHVRVDAWLTPKLCVTAAAAYVLALYQELTPQYEASCAYLVRHQHADGSWESYWWTSSIYATAFAVLALARRPEHEGACEAARQWLAARQAPTGAWHDDTPGAQPSAFFTALALKALLTDPTERYAAATEQGASWLLGHQTSDGSWIPSRILRIPATDVHEPQTVKHWRASSFGVNVLVDDHNRIFTTSTALNALSVFAKTRALTPAYC
ncbi:prenyltransferase/squalene oxidase repeat-containing protein [Hymenobacter algoricola]|uniref:Squalene cyclase C-terminal domain-containing protein n=1 Tax=Hymenobacter algoricola TaxID=486267 RepID=A0ABP7N284_9BACT